MYAICVRNKYLKLIRLPGVYNTNSNYIKMKIFIKVKQSIKSIKSCILKEKQNLLFYPLVLASVHFIIPKTLTVFNNFRRSPSSMNAAKH